MLEPAETKFPVWVMANQAAYEKVGLPEALAFVDDDELEYTFLPLFTNQRLAEECIEDHDFDGCAAIQIENPMAFYEWLSGLARQQVTHVRYDFCMDPEVPEVEVDLGAFFLGLARAGGA